MLALFSTYKSTPEELYDYPTLLSEEPLKPVSFLPFSGDKMKDQIMMHAPITRSFTHFTTNLTFSLLPAFSHPDDEQRLISNSVNSQVNFPTSLNDSVDSMTPLRNVSMTTFPLSKDILKFDSFTDGSTYGGSG